MIYLLLVLLQLLLSLHLINGSDNELPLLSVVHVTAGFKSHLQGAALTLSSWLQNTPSSNLIADYFLIMPKLSKNTFIDSPLCNIQPEYFNLWCLDEIKVLNISRNPLIKYISKTPDAKNHKTWRLQMLIKIFASTKVRTKYFITVDSDTLLTKNLDSSSYLLPFGKARVSAEKRSMHDNWYMASERLLDARGCFDEKNGNQHMIGVTPAVLHRDTMINTASRLLRIYGTHPTHPMRSVLKATLGAYGPTNSWTEYSAYRIMSCLRADFYNYHSFSPEPSASPDIPSPILYRGIWDDNDFNRSMTKENKPGLKRAIFVGNINRFIKIYFTI